MPRLPFNKSSQSVQHAMTDASFNEMMEMTTSDTAFIHYRQQGRLGCKINAAARGRKDAEKRPLAMQADYKEDPTH